MGVIGLAGHKRFKSYEGVLQQSRLGSVVGNTILSCQIKVIFKVFGQYIG